MGTGGGGSLPQELEAGQWGEDVEEEEEEEEEEDGKDLRGNSMCKILGHEDRVWA